jgi:prepilin-type N-terminal cleavage/methylation domain-containing protein
MTLSRRNQAGFTLIELLTVIAIIGILSTFVFAGVPRILLSAKVADARNTMGQMRLALEEYHTDHGSYPPAYGYLDRLAIDELTKDERLSVLSPGGNNFRNTPSCDDRYDDPDDCSDDRYFVSRHYMHFTNQFKMDDLYDRFALDGNDTDFDNYISRLEYVPRDGKDNTINDYSSFVVDGGRPFVYVPVNMRQFKKVAREWIQNWKDNPNTRGPRPDDSVAINVTLQNMHFPPPFYDAYLLISVGPDRNTRGIIHDLVGNTTALRSTNYGINYHYHIAALATFFMGTRDMNIVNTTDGYVAGDGFLDFEYSDRKGSGTTGQESNYFPLIDGPGVYAPLIYIGGGFNRSFEDGLVVRGN